MHMFPGAMALEAWMDRA